MNKGQARSVNAKKNILGLFLLKGISIILSLVMIPMTIGYVSSMQYGIWITLSSLTAWISFFDIGFGNGLKNKFIEAITLGDKKRARIYVSTTYAIIIMIIGSLWILLMTGINFADWSKILNAPPAMANELKNVAFIVASSFCFQFILKLIDTLLNAIQKPALSSCFDTLSQVIIIVSIFILIRTTSGSLIMLSIVTGCTYICVLIISSIWFFSRELKEYRPSIKFINFTYAKDLMGLGMKFFFLQILAILFYSTNNIIIAQICGPEDVTVYNIAYKYMSIINMGFTILITPFWSAFAEAYVKKDYEWMIKTTRVLKLLVISVAALGIIFLICSPWVYKLWIKDVVAIPFILTALICLYQIINIWCSMYSSILYGIGKIKIQMICSAIICLANVPLTITGCYYWGMTGLVCAQILPSCINVWVGPYQLRKILNQTANGIWSK